MDDSPRPAQKLALVTGASRGIGAATAEALAAAGFHVVLTARTTAGLEAVEERIHAAGGSATIAPLDLTDLAAIERLGSAIAARWAALDVLVLNAAMLGTLAAVPAIDAKELANVLALNVTSQAAIIGAFDPLLRAAGAARVIALTSSVAAAPRAYWGGYGASKAALEVLLQSYAEETRRFGRIAVAIVDPGATRTVMRARAFPGEDPAHVKPPEVVAAQIAALAQEPFETGLRLRVNEVLQPDLNV